MLEAAVNRTLKPAGKVHRLKMELSKIKEAKPAVLMLELDKRQEARRPRAGIQHKE